MSQRAQGPEIATTRDRIIEVATALFAERGYAATPIAAIQSAAGLAPGSGALYKHFPNKAALLDGIIAAYERRLDAETDDILEQLPADTHGALVAIAAGLRRSMLGEAPVIRLLLRDLDHRPDLVERVWNTVLQAVPGRFLSWLRSARAAGAVRSDVTDDEGVVLMAALMEASTIDVLVRRDFSPVLAREFDDAWVALALRVLGSK